MAGGGVMLGTLVAWAAAAFLIGGAYCAFRLERRFSRYAHHPNAAYVDALFVAHQRERRLLASAHQVLTDDFDIYGDVPGIPVHMIGDRNV